MMNLPTVQASIHKKPLLLYLATNSYAIGALIAQEDGGGTERPIYYISRTLKDAKTRYLRAERACLAIVYASQRLRHYFLVYEVLKLCYNNQFSPVGYPSGCYNYHNMT